MATPPQSTPDSSPAAMVEEIKQGNERERDLIKQMRDNLDKILAGLQKESANRNDACDKLSESMKTMNFGLPAAQKASLVRMIKEAIEICKTAKRKATSTFNFHKMCMPDEAEKKVKKRAQNLERLRVFEASVERIKGAAMQTMDAGAGNTDVLEKLGIILEECELTGAMLEEDIKMYKPWKFNAESEIHSIQRGKWRRELGVRPMFLLRSFRICSRR